MRSKVSQDMLRRKNLSKNISPSRLSSQCSKMRQVTWFTLFVLVIKLCFCSCRIKDTDHDPQVDGIVRGSVAEKSQFSHYVALFYFGQFTCGGSVISSKFILTAAHCVTGGIEGLNVLVGSESLEFNPHQLLVVEKVKIHEKYDDKSAEMNDVALIMLKYPVKFSDSVKAIELETKDIQLGSKVTTVGYGHAYHNFEAGSKHLRFTDVFVRGNNGCSSEDAAETILCLESRIHNIVCEVSEVNVSKKLICVNFCFVFNSSDYQGDAGGSAIQNGKLVGITSFISTYACGFFPDSYMKVSFYVDWIENNMDIMLENQPIGALLSTASLTCKSNIVIHYIIIVLNILNARIFI